MPNKGKKHAGGAKGQGGKKTDGTSKPSDKKSSETAEKKHETASASASAAAASSSRVPTSPAKTMKPADTKPKSTAKTDPAKSTQTTVPKSTTTTTSSTTVKPSTEKVPAKQDAKAVQPRKKSDPVVTSGAVGKAAAASVVATSKPKDGGKEEKKTVSVAQVAAVPATTDKDDALDELIDSLGGPDDVPESPKFTGPEIADTPATSEYLEELGKRESTIPPEYRHLLDGKGEKPAPPPPRDAKQSIGDDDLVAGLDFLSSPAPPEEKKPKLEEKKEAKPISSAPAASAQPRTELQKKEAKPVSSERAPSAQPSAELQKKEAKPTLSATAAPAQPSEQALSEDALDELLGTLEGPPTTEPESPQYTGPEVTETITQTYQEELGKRDFTIPPAYRHLLDGKDHGKPVPPPSEQLSPMSDISLVDGFSKDFEGDISPAAVTTPAFQPKDAARDKQAKSDVVVPSSASSVQSASAPSAGMESALDDLMGTLEGPEFTVPESPVYTGPEVTETSTATYIEELGKRDSTIPPEYRHLLDGKGEKPVPATPEDKPMTDSELADAFDKEFSGPEPPVAQQTPPSVTPAKPQETPKGKEPQAETVVSASSTSSALQAAPAPTKGPSGKCDPLDALAGTLVTRKEDPKDKKPVADKVKEKTGKESREKLGEDEETIPPEYRLKEIKDKDGKPLLPQPEEKPKPMSEDELLDALTEGFDTTPVPSQSAPLQSSAKPPGKSGSEEIVSFSKASAVQSAAATSPSASMPDDALDLLSDSLGERQPDPDENKPVVDVVKERAKAEHIDRLGDRDSTIPPEYRHLLDGKDQGKPSKPEVVKPKTSLSDDAAIDLLSSGFASCETSSSDKTQNSSKDKVEKCPSVQKPETSGKVPDSSKDKVEKSSSSTPVCKAIEKVPEASKDKVEKSSSVQKSETSGKVPDSSKSTSQSTLETPSAQKTGKR